jgi:hypothetical protein
VIKQIKNSGCFSNQYLVRLASKACLCFHVDFLTHKPHRKNVRINCNLTIDGHGSLPGTGRKFTFQHLNQNWLQGLDIVTGVFLEGGGGKRPEHKADLTSPSNTYVNIECS